ncbi:putative RING finger protein [Zancudomyces culisetae]|uniref:Putative RING finger protein n=1 Tax=Zancudomyces culisetae TaxID=1213189 RepID=A0A1R1PYE8_ZANCU|nr:putative RING finger protein [Zancudomyces culisetae]|eukprot:OMH85970.1 putative RING finger protein [Zancudomyces culisetae]
MGQTTSTLSREEDNREGVDMEEDRKSKESIDSVGPAAKIQKLENSDGTEDRNRVMEDGRRGVAGQSDYNPESSSTSHSVYRTGYHGENIVHCTRKKRKRLSRQSCVEYENKKRDGKEKEVEEAVDVAEIAAEPHSEKEADGDGREEECTMEHIEGRRDLTGKFREENEMETEVELESNIEGRTDRESTHESMMKHAGEECGISAETNSEERKEEEECRKEEDVTEKSDEGSEEREDVRDEVIPERTESSERGEEQIRGEERESHEGQEAGRGEEQLEQTVIDNTSGTFDRASSNNLLAAAVARSVIRATRLEFDRNHQLFNEQEGARENIWPTIRGRMNSTSTLTHDGQPAEPVRQEQQEQAAQQERPEQAEQSEGIGEEGGDSQPTNTNEYSGLSRSQEGAHLGSLSMGLEGGIQTEGRMPDDDSSLNREGNVGEQEFQNAERYIDIPGNYQFRVFPILVEPQTQQPQTQQPQTQTQTQTQPQTQHQEQEQSQTDIPTNPPSNGDADEEESVSSRLHRILGNRNTLAQRVSTQREALRRMLHGQNAGQQQVPVIIVGVQSRSPGTGLAQYTPSPLSAEHPLSSQNTNSEQDATPQESQVDTYPEADTGSNSNIDTNSTLNRLHLGRFRSLFDRIYSRLSRFVPGMHTNNSSSAGVQQQSQSGQGPATGLSSQDATNPATNMNNAALGSNGLVVYVFATTFALTHPLLLSFLASSLFPGLMDSNESLLANASSGQMYDDFVAFADLLGQVRQPTATIEQVDAQLPIYEYCCPPLSDQQQNDPDTTPAGPVLLKRFVQDSSLHTDSKCGDDMSLPTTTQEQVATDFLSCEKCLICLEEYKHADRLRVLSCRHGFHSDCIASWITKGANKCPVCRADAVKSAS